MSSSQEPCYLGIDVGTGSARAALVSTSGAVLASHTQNTQTWRDKRDARVFEQSTSDIWGAICTCVQTCLKESGVSPERVQGVGFDATCSLAVVDGEGNPITVSRDGLGGTGERNIVLWADHRAEEEAETINASGAVPLDFVGGTMSLEMEIPKILWLKKHMTADAFSKCHFFDLPDYLTYRATGTPLRSFCSLTCKCSYVPSKGGWQAAFFETIGLGDLVNDDYKQLGGREGEVRSAGMPVGHGLNDRAAAEMGLVKGTPVGSAIIDAYAGWLGTVAATHTNGSNCSAPGVAESRHRLAAVAGTSTCYIVNTPDAEFVPGVWGPYRDTVFPGWWMNEGGQSSTGQLIEFVIEQHKAGTEARLMGEKEGKEVYDVLRDILEGMREEKKKESVTEVTKDLHFYPDLHGNRSPIADPKMRGSLVGLALDDSVHDLAAKFHVTLEAIALQTRHIVDTMNEHGHAVNSLYLSGSQAKNAPLMALLADCCGMDVVIPNKPGVAVVLGAAMLGRMAAEDSGGKLAEMQGAEQAEKLWNIMTEMTPPARVVSPSASPREKKLLEAKYQIFRESIEIQKRWRVQMEQAASA